MRKVKNNGFSFPLHPFQCIAYGIIFYQVVIASSIFIPLLEGTEQIIISVLYLPSKLTVVIFGYLTTKSDPTDKVVYEHRNALANNESFDSSRYPSVCTICGTSVTCSSKHCGYCNRCVVRFDHHCKWLNNCIGEANYKQFAVLIIALEISEIVLMGSTWWFLVEVLDDPDKYERRVMDVYHSDVFDMVVTLLFLLAGLSVVVAIAIGNLIGLHIWLRNFKHMTTYEYILFLRSKHKYNAVAHAPDANDVSGEQGNSALQLVPDSTKLHKSASKRTSPISMTPTLVLGPSDSFKVPLGAHTKSSNSRVEHSGQGSPTGSRNTK